MKQLAIVITCKRITAVAEVRHTVTVDLPSPNLRVVQIPAGRGPPGKDGKDGDDGPPGSPGPPGGIGDDSIIILDGGNF